MHTYILYIKFFISNLTFCFFKTWNIIKKINFFLFMIIILTQCFPSRVGGIESLVSNLALGLAKKEKVIVFADRHHFFYDAIFDNQNKDKILVRRTSGIKFFRRRKKVKEIKPFIESRKVKLVLADTWKSLELCIDYLKQKKIPTFCLAHGNELLANNENKYQRISETLKKVDSIIANSEFTSKLVEKILPNKKGITFVYPGASDLRNVKSNNFIKISGNPVLITLGRLEKRKGHINILSIIRKLKVDFPTIQYFIAGEGPEKSNLIKLVKKKDLIQNVFFTGLIDNGQKKFLFENSDLMVMPTLDESNNRSIEGFGISYLEAAFFAVPSIASDVGGTNEAVLNDSTGIIIKNIDELYKSVRELLMDKNKRGLLGHNAQKRSIEQFRWNVAINKYFSIFQI